MNAKVDYYFEDFETEEQALERIRQLVLKEFNEEIKFQNQEFIDLISKICCKIILEHSKIEHKFG